MKQGIDEAIFKTISLIVVTVVDFTLMIFNALVGTILWNWYVPLAFPGAASISLWVIFGLSLLVTHLTYKNPTTKEIAEDAELTFWEMLYAGLTKSVITNIARPVTMLAYGWVVHQFVLGAVTA